MNISFRPSVHTFKQKAPVSPRSPRFGSVAHVTVVSENQADAIKAAKALLNALQEAYTSVSAHGFQNTIFNRLIPFTLLLNAADAVTIANKKGEVIMFTGPDCKLLAAATKVYERLKTEDPEKSTLLSFYAPKDRPDMQSAYIAMLNSFLSSTTSAKDDLEIFEGSS